MIDRIVIFIHGCIDICYPPFRGIFPLQTFRYAACGGGNTLLDIMIFYGCHEYLFKREMVDLNFVTLTPHIAAFLLGLSVTFPIGFFLSRYVVFENTEGRKREQLPKYMMVVIGAILLNYFFLKVFIETLSLSAIIAKLFTTAIVVAFSYYAQKYFTFKSQTDPEL
ncbi:MAG: GtrA family protein [Bacteroidota bacterium]